MATTIYYSPTNTSTASYDDKGVRKYKRELIVQYDAPVVDPNVVKATAGVPQGWDTYPSDRLALVSNVSCTQVAGPCIWKVLVDYSTKVGDQSQVTTSPLTQPPKTSWAWATYQQAISKDIDGNAILNAAGDPYLPPPEVDRSRLTITVAYNVDLVPTWLLDYQDAINTAAVAIEGLTFAPYTLKCNIQSIGHWENDKGVYFRPLVLQLHAVWEGWRLSLLNQGYSALYGGTKKKIHINGQEPSTAQLLNADGTLLVYGVGTANYRTHKVFREKDFARLNLPAAPAH